MSLEISQGLSFSLFGVINMMQGGLHYHLPESLMWLKGFLIIIESASQAMPVQ